MHSTFAPLYDFHLSSAGALLVVIYGVIIGGALGSFLNVVAYRLPLAMNLSRPGSRCPKCKRPIRPWHNLPVLGWLLLRGRCRDCGAPISPRYPLVELLAAAASGIVVWRSISGELIGENWEYSINVIAVLLRLMLVMLLLTSALLEFDDNRLPLQLNYGVALGLLVGAVLVAELRPPQPHLVLPPVDVLALPLLSALVLGLLSWPVLLLPPAAAPASGVARLCLLVVFALVFGALATMFVALVAAALMLAVVTSRYFWPPARRLGWASALLLATLVWCLLAGPQLSSNDVVALEGFLIVPDMHSVLIPVGLSTAALTILARLVAWPLAGNPRPAR